MSEMGFSFADAGKKVNNGVKSIVQSISSVIAISTVFVLVGIMFFDIGNGAGDRLADPFGLFLRQV